MKKPLTFHLLIVIMTVTTLAVAAISIFELYDTAFKQHRLRLIETVQSHARLIEAIAQFSATHHGGELTNDWQTAALRQVRNAHRQFVGFGKTGEFTLARRDGSQIVFVLSHRHYDLDTPKPVPIVGKWAEPMRRALAGESGTVIGLDYRGKQVLAAYEPVGLLDFGLVAKLDLAEIRAPFISAGVVAIVVALLLILLASTLFFRITQPIARKIEQQAETFRTLALTAHEGIFLIDTHGIIQFVNPAAEVLFGYPPDELLGNNINRLMPSPHSKAHDHYLSQYLKTGITNIIGTGRQLTGLRKDGSHFPIHLSVGDINLKHIRLFAGVVMDISEQQQLQHEIMEIPEREQRRIGQELHDSLGQQLTGLSMLAKSLLNKAAKPEHDLAVQLANGLQEALAQVRTLSRGLMPVQIDAHGFMNALELLTADIEHQSNTPINLVIDHIIHLSNNVTAMHLYRIAQEALNNAVKHASAQRISVSLKIANDQGLLEIYDDGCGIPTHLDDSSGIGLRIMKHRSALFGGVISINADENGGTRLRCYFPIDPPEDPN